MPVGPWYLISAGKVLMLVLAVQVVDGVSPLTRQAFRFVVVVTV